MELLAQPFDELPQLVVQLGQRLRLLVHERDRHDHESSLSGLADPVLVVGLGPGDPAIGVVLEAHAVP